MSSACEATSPGLSVPETSPEGKSSPLPPHTLGLGRSRKGQTSDSWASLCSGRAGVEQNCRELVAPLWGALLALRLSGWGLQGGEGTRTSPSTWRKERQAPPRQAACTGLWRRPCPRNLRTSANRNFNPGMRPMLSSELGVFSNSCPPLYPAGLSLWEGLASC